MRIARVWFLSIIALLALSCASANKLSQRSERALAAGDLRGAYEQARAAVAKSPSNPRAKKAFATASSRLVEDRKTRITTIAGVDTVAAAQQVLALSELRGEIMRYGAVLPADTAFAHRETALRLGAAGILYSRAESELESGRPKLAWADFRAVGAYAPGYRDVGRRIDEAYTQALSRVAFLPLADQAGVPGISRALADRIYAEVSPHIRDDDLRFTQVMDPGEVYARITVAELDELDRDDAVRIGRRLGVDEVVTGRVYGLRSRTNSREYDGTLYRKIVDRDTSGEKRVRYVEQDFHAVEREREVTVHYDLELVDVDDETSLAVQSDAPTAYARVVFTDFQAQGDCGDYCLVPPQLAQSNRERADRIETQWKSHFGSWTVPSLLERARKERTHRRYAGGDRAAFFSDCHARPVWLGELPGENDLAGIALDAIGRPVLGILRELDAK